MTGNYWRYDEDQDPDGPLPYRRAGATGLGFSSCHALMGLALCCYDYSSWMDLISTWWGLGLRVGWREPSPLSRKVASRPGIENGKFLSLRQIGGWEESMSLSSNSNMMTSGQELRPRVFSSFFRTGHVQISGQREDSSLKNTDALWEHVILVLIRVVASHLICRSKSQTHLHTH